MLASFIIFCTPVFSVSRDIVSIRDGSSYILKTENGLKPGPGHFIVLTIRTENPGHHDHPFGTGVIKWSSETGTDEIVKQQRFRIYVDELTHKYYIPVGQDRNWYENDIINNLSFEIPFFIS